MSYLSDSLRISVDVSLQPSERGFPLLLLASCLRQVSAEEILKLCGAAEEELHQS